MSCNATEQNNEESQPNDKEMNDLAREEDAEKDKKVITLYVTKNVNKEWSDTKSVYETLKVVKKIVKEWMTVDDNVHVVDKHNVRMGIDENWAYGVRTTGRYEKNNMKIELFLKIRTSVQLCRLKQKVRNMCENESVWIKQKHSGLEHVKRIGVLIGVCVPHSSLEWYQEKVAQVGQIERSKIEIKKEKVHQNNYSGLGVVVCGVEN